MLLPAISYIVKIRTGDGDDNGTESHAWVNILGSKKKQQTGKLYLDLIGTKRKFEAGSVETFSLEGPDIGEVKQLEVSVIELFLLIFYSQNEKESMPKTCVIP